MPVLPSLCTGKGEKDCECAERFPTETASSASWGTYIQQKNRGTKSMFTNIHIHTYMYVIMLSHGETKWIGHSLDVLKLGFM